MNLRQTLFSASGANHLQPVASITFAEGLQACSIQRGPSRSVSDHSSAPEDRMLKLAQWLTTCCAVAVALAVVSNVVSAHGGDPTKIHACVVTIPQAPANGT